MPGAKGQAHNDSDFRRFLPDYTHLDMGKYEDGWLEPYREAWDLLRQPSRSEEHTSELQSLMRISYAVFCLKKKNKKENLKQIQQLITIMINKNTYTKQISQ